MNRIQNPNCDGATCTRARGELRSLPIDKDSNMILCRSCFDFEIAWRKGRNKELEPSARFDTPNWEDLKVYEVNA